MKHLAFLLALFISLAAAAQPGFTPINQKYRWLSGAFDSTLAPPVRDTTRTPLRVGELTFRPVDSSFYVAISTSGPKKWDKIGSAVGKLNISDTTSMLLGYPRLQRFLDSLSAIRSAIGGLGANFYTSNGTLTGTRTVTMNNHSINFNGGAFGFNTQNAGGAWSNFGGAADGVSANSFVGSGTSSFATIVSSGVPRSYMRAQFNSSASRLDIYPDSILFSPQGGKLRVASMETTADSAFKPMVYNHVTREWKQFDYWPGWGGGDETTDSMSLYLEWPLHIVDDTILAINLFSGADTGAITPAMWALKADILHSHDATQIITGVLPPERGGTGLSTLGSPGQVWRVNSAGTGMEFYTPSSGGGSLTLDQVLTNGNTTNQGFAVNGQANFGGGLYIKAWTEAGANTAWIDMPIGGPSGIGHGGPGMNPWIALAAYGGQYLTDASPGNIIYRGSRLLWGNSGSEASGMSLESNTLNIRKAPTIGEGVNIKNNTDGNLRVTLTAGTTGGAVNVHGSNGVIAGSFMAHPDGASSGNIFSAFNRITLKNLAGNGAIELAGDGTGAYGAPLRLITSGGNRQLYISGASGSGGEIIMNDITSGTEFYHAYLDNTADPRHEFKNSRVVFSGTTSVQFQGAAGSGNRMLYVDNSGLVHVLAIGPEDIIPVYASYSLVADKTFSASNTAEVIPLDTELIENGITHTGSSEEITFTTAGKYQITATAHAQSTSADAVKIGIQRWNGSAWENITATGSIIRVESSNTFPGTLNYILDVNEGHKIRFTANATSTGAILNAIDAVDGMPSIPAFRVTIQKL